MALAANPKSRKKAKGTLPPLSVAKDFMAADKKNKNWKKVERKTKRPPGASS
jgi:hypothetical protein